MDSKSQKLLFNLSQLGHGLCFKYPHKILSFVVSYLLYGLRYRWYGIFSQDRKRSQMTERSVNHRVFQNLKKVYGFLLRNNSFFWNFWKFVSFLFCCFRALLGQTFWYLSTYLQLQNVIWHKYHHKDTYFEFLAMFLLDSHS